MHDPVNISLGRIALSQGLISQEQARLVLDEATRSQRSFVEIAQLRGLLSDSACSKILDSFSVARSPAPNAHPSIQPPTSAPHFSKPHIAAAPAASVESHENTLIASPKTPSVQTSRSTPSLELQVPQPGDEIDGYRVLRKLGQGGMGAVFEVEKAGRHFALKLVLGELQDAEIERFRREGEAAARVDRHPNIVGVHSAGEWLTRPYLVFDFISGEDLDKVLRREQKLTNDDLLSILIPVTEAIAHAHKSGIIHRDLKPANILLRIDLNHDDNSINNNKPQCSYGHPMVGDFGLARIDSQERMTRTGEILGTPAYMAPEQVAGEKSAGPAQDVWALGVIAYECLCGERPFQGTSPMNVFHNVLTKTPTPLHEKLPELPSELAAIITRCLQKELGDRYLSANELLADLRAFQAGEALEVALPGSLTLIRRFLWRRGIALGLALTASTALLFSVRQGPRPLEASNPSVPGAKNRRNPRERDSPASRSLCPELLPRTRNTKPRGPLPRLAKL